MNQATKNPIDWTKYSDFQTRVFRAILKIPRGQVWTYGEVARRIGRPGAARAVGQALSRNQDAPVIPCHRVVGYNGIGGYSAPGGFKRKIMLLKQENYLRN